MFIRYLTLIFLLTFCTAEAATITISCDSTGIEGQLCKRHAQDWAKARGHEVRFFSPPTSPTEKLALYRQLFAARSADIDVIVIDAVWPGVIRDHLIDLRPFSKGQEREHFPAIIANNTVNERLLAMPWYVDAGLLFYRKDMLERYKLPVPKTWDELERTAQYVQKAERERGNSDFQGFVFQAKAYEGLSCNALEWIASFGGGQIVETDGSISIHNPAAEQALSMAARWIGTIAPRGVLNYAEEEARGVFQSGKALFMRNWPYAWALAQQADSPIRDLIGVALLPQSASGRHAAALGGWQLGISRYSTHPALAADLVMYLSSAAIQKERAIKGSFNPTRPLLYQDEDILRNNRFMAELGLVFAEAVSRPAAQTGLKYPQVSQAFWDSTHAVLSGKTDAPSALKKLDAKLKQIKRRSW